MSVVVLDFGSQYTQLIVRRLRELGVLSVVLPGTAPVERVRAERPEAIVLSGSPSSVHETAALRPDFGIFNLDVPLLGLCYGFHLLVERFGGKVVPTRIREYGRAEIESVSAPLSEALAPGDQIWMSHADSVETLPEGWLALAKTSDNPIAAAVSPDGRLVGIQFHPEVAHTLRGSEVLGLFLDRADVTRDWTPPSVLERLVEETAAYVGKERVLLGISGGVDSSTLALLLARAGVDHLGVFVDHGLLRAGERDEVADALTTLGVRLRVVDARKRFFGALR